MMTNDNEELRELLEMQREVEMMSRKISRLAEKYALRMQKDCTVKRQENIVLYGCDEEKIATDYLLQIGMPMNLLGFKYSRYALIKMLKGKEEKRWYLTKELYPDIAKKFDTTSSRVERAIRHAVHTVYVKNEENDFFKEMSVKKSKGCPTNSEFLTFIVEKIRLKI